MLGVGSSLKGETCRCDQPKTSESNCDNRHCPDYNGIITGYYKVLQTSIEDDSGVLCSYFILSLIFRPYLRFHRSVPPSPQHHVTGTEHVSLSSHQFATFVSSNYTICHACSLMNDISFYTMFHRHTSQPAHRSINKSICVMRSEQRSERRTAGRDSTRLWQTRLSSATLISRIHVSNLFGVCMSESLQRRWEIRFCRSHCSVGAGLMRRLPMGTRSALKWRRRFVTAVHTTAFWWASGMKLNRFGLLNCKSHLCYLSQGHFHRLCCLLWGFFIFIFPDLCTQRRMYLLSQFGKRWGKKRESDTSVFNKLHVYI